VRLVQPAVRHPRRGEPVPAHRSVRPAVHPRVGRPRLAAGPPVAAPPPRPLAPRGVDRVLVVRVVGPLRPAHERVRRQVGRTRRTRHGGLHGVPGRRDRQGRRRRRAGRGQVGHHGRPRHLLARAQGRRLLLWRQLRRRVRRVVGGPLARAEALVVIVVVAPQDGRARQRRGLVGLGPRHAGRGLCPERHGQRARVPQPGRRRRAGDAQAHGQAGGGGPCAWRRGGEEGQQWRRWRPERARVGLGHGQGAEGVGRGRRRRRAGTGQDEEEGPARVVAELDRRPPCPSSTASTFPSIPSHDHKLYTPHILLDDVQVLCPTC
ncbi:uncharacterized protein RHOBADRAFT_55837, partial [Rhodotorula graminis WP1]